MLIVDDEDLVRDSLRFCLSAEATRSLPHATAAEETDALALLGKPFDYTALLKRFEEHFNATCDEHE